MLISYFFLTLSSCPGRLTAVSSSCFFEQKQHQKKSARRYAIRTSQTVPGAAIYEIFGEWGIINICHTFISYFFLSFNPLISRYVNSSIFFVFLRTTTATAAATTTTTTKALGTRYENVVRGTSRWEGIHIFVRDTST